MECLKMALKVIELTIALNATNATSERSLSKSKLLKTYLQSTMSQAHLNHYMMFSVYKEHVDTLDLPALDNEYWHLDIQNIL